MKTLIKRFRFSSIKKQFLTLTVLSILIVCFFSVMISISMRKALLQTNIENMETLVDKFIAEINTVSQQAENISTQLQYNIATTNLLEADSYKEIGLDTINAINQQLTSIFWLNDAIVDIAFVNDLVYWSHIFSKNDLIEITRSADSYGISALGTYYNTLYPNRTNPYFVFSTAIYSNYKPLGTILISFDMEKTTMQYSDSSANNSLFMLYDTNKHLTPFNCSSENAQEIFSRCIEYLPAKAPEESRTFHHIVSDSDYLIGLSYIDNVNSYLISAVPLSNTAEKLAAVQRYTSLTIVASFAFIVILGIMLYFNFIAPLNIFHKTIIQLKKQKLRRLEHPMLLNGCSEVRDIGNEFSELLLSIHELNVQIVKTSNNLYEAELQHKIAELAFLRSQINPHFLYNTLELMRGIAQEKQVPEVAKIAVSIAKILRYSIKGDEFVTLNQEIDIVRAYLNIQVARFSDKISVIIDIKEDAEESIIMKMLLQPLVENAIFYGLEPLDENGILYISGYISEGLLHITVRDNGVGIEPELLKQLQENLNSEIYDTSKHIGLINTNARIKLNYGHRYGLTISSSLGDGTCVTLILPYTNA